MDILIKHFILKGTRERASRPYRAVNLFYFYNYLAKNVYLIFAVTISLKKLCGDYPAQNMPWLKGIFPID